MEDEKYIKVLFCGYTGVGCNQLVNILTNEQFKENEQCLYNWNCRVKTIKINNKQFVIELWNGPGQEKFRSLGKIFIKNSDIMIFVYDITKRESFNDLKDYHIPAAYKILGNNFKGVIVANKSDLYIK